MDEREKLTPVVVGEALFIIKDDEVYVYSPEQNQFHGVPFIDAEEFDAPSIRIGTVDDDPR